MKLALLLVLFLFAACGGGGGGGSDNHNSLDAPKLIGDWDFLETGVQCSNDTSSSISFFVSFSNDNSPIFVTAKLGHIGLNCSSSPAYLSSVGYQYNVSGNSIDFSFIDELITIMDSSFLSQANANNLCGFNNWALNTPRSVYNTSCSSNLTEEFRWTGVNVSNSTLKFNNPDGDPQTLFRIPEKQNILHEKLREKIKTKINYLL